MGLLLGHSSDHGPHHAEQGRQMRTVHVLWHSCWSYEWRKYLAQPWSIQ